MFMNNLIIVVDDDENARMIVRTILLSAGYAVETYSSGAEAIERFSNIKPSLVILDIMMPEMNGYEVMMRIKQNPKTQEIPVIFLSAKGDSEDLILGYNEYCVEYYITKPFTPQQLLSGVKLVLNNPS